MSARTRPWSSYKLQEEVTLAPPCFLPFSARGLLSPASALQRVGSECLALASAKTKYCAVRSAMLILCASGTRSEAERVTRDPHSRGHTTALHVRCTCVM